MLSTPRTKAIGTETSSRPRTTSVTISTGLRRIRSTQAPANRPMRRNGKLIDAFNAPIWKADALSVSMAVRGIASALTWLPKTLTVVESQNRRQSGSRHRREDDASTISPGGSCGDRLSPSSRLNSE